MMRYSFFLLCVLLGLLSAPAAGPGELRGSVRDAATEKPVAGVIVKAGGAFASTGRDGSFVLKLKHEADSVSFRSMGYEALTLPATADLSDVRLDQKATRLNDVIVEAPDIYARGDTLVFNVARYANAKDNAIIDVIKRLPGIKVKDDGTIEYQGKPINKFYIDGNDFIGGQYGLATNNISHRDVKSVEVMENHQPVKALEGIEFPEEAGINLKLKDDARSRWVGVSNAGAGVGPFLFDGSLFTMRMAPKFQNMFTLKADNTGWNPAGEIRDREVDMMFSSDYAASLWPEYISADAADAPLPEKRTRDNLSMLANAISAWRAGDTSMKLKLNYIADRLDYNSGITTDYFSQQIPTFIQDNSLRTRRHELSARFYSETNKRGYYMKDKFSLGGEWNSSNSSITGSSTLRQRVDRKDFQAENDLKLVRRNDKKLFTVASRISFHHRPDRLLVSGDENVAQVLGTTDFRSITESCFGKLTRFWQYSVTTALDLNYHRINRSLSGLDEFDNHGVDGAFLASVGASPRISHERNGWRTTLDVPLRWSHYSMGGQHDYFNAAPRFSVRRQLSSKSELSGNASYRLVNPQTYLNIGEPILSDWRNLFISWNPERYSQEFGASLSYRYRNPMKSLFFNLSANYSHRRAGLISNQLFVGDFIISTCADRLSVSETWSVKGGLSKGIGHSRMVCGFETYASFSSASSMRDNDVIPYRQGVAGIKPYFKGSILKWLSADYEAEYGFSRLSIKEVRNNYHSFHQKLFSSILPDDRLQFTVGAEHFLTRFPEGNVSNLVLLDASAVWRISDRTRLSLTADNLLNRRSYEYVTYGTLSRSDHYFRLRPLTLLLSLQSRF